MTLYHETFARVAQTILENGFCDGPGSYRTKKGWRKGVWFSDDPLTYASGNNEHWALLQVTIELSADEMASFRWADDEKLWLIPAAKINAKLRQSDVIRVPHVKPPVDHNFGSFHEGE